MASYQGAPYEAGVGPDDAGVVLFAACPPPEDLHFEPATGHWRKKVSRTDVQMLYQSRPVGTFRGERCVVLDDLTDRLHIAYLGHDAFRAEQLGFWEVDRGVFELITPRQEVTDIVEQRLPLPLRGDGDSRTGPASDASRPADRLRAAAGERHRPGHAARARPPRPSRVRAARRPGPVPRVHPGRRRAAAPARGRSHARGHRRGAPRQEEPAQARSAGLPGRTRRPSRVRGRARRVRDRVSLASPRPYRRAG